MTRTKVTSEAFSVGGQVAGLALGLPFFFVSLIWHSNSSVWSSLALGYMTLVVFPAASCVGSAMATLVAPIGQEQVYAREPAIGFVAVLLAFIVLEASMQLYAYWPFLSGQQLWRTLLGPSTKPIIPTLLGGIMLVPVSAVLGYVAGRYGQRHPTHFIARSLKFCWKVSKIDPLANPAV